MSCFTCGTISGCGCSQPPACNYNVTVNSGTSTVIGAVNANTAGVGVFDALDNGVLYFRGVESADATYLSVSLNATNHTILLTFNVNAFAAALPQASTTQAGIGETATNAEAQAKASTTVFLTPSNLAALGASDTFVGLVELATDAETQTGTSTTLAVTPAGLKSVTDLLGTTEVYADAVTLAAGTPAFVGQFAAQQDTGEAFVGNATSAGAWNSLFTFGAVNATGSANTTINNIGATIWDGNGTGVFTFIGAGVVLDSGSELTVSSGCNLNMAPGSTMTYGGSSIPANSVITTGASIGQLSSSLKSTFVSTANTQTGYTAFSNPATIRTCDTSTVTLQQLAQLVGTLIEDLKAVKLPAT